MPVLSIQSHVVYGHEAWAINTAGFSNHTGYKAWRGEALNPALAECLVPGMEATRRAKSRELLIITAQDELKTSTFKFRAVKV